MIIYIVRRTFYKILCTNKPPKMAGSPAGHRPPIRFKYPQSPTVPSKAMIPSAPLLLPNQDHLIDKADPK